MGFCIAIAVSGAVFCYLLSAVSWIVGVIGFALLVEGNTTARQESLSIDCYPYWFFTVGTPVALIVSGLQMLLLACQVQKKFCWVLCSLPLVFMPTFIFFSSGGMVYKDTGAIHSIVLAEGTSLRLEQVYTILRFTGALGTAVFLMMAMICEFGAMPFVFSEHSSRNQVVDASFAPMTSSSPPPVSWSAKNTARRSSTSSTNSLVKPNDSHDPEEPQGSSHVSAVEHDGVGDPSKKSKLEMAEKNQEAVEPTVDKPTEETKF
jgi:hypothetical protein